MFPLTRTNRGPPSSGSTASSWTPRIRLQHPQYCRMIAGFARNSRGLTVAREPESQRREWWRWDTPNSPSDAPELGEARATEAEMDIRSLGGAVAGGRTSKNGKPGTRLSCGAGDVGGDGGGSISHLQYWLRGFTHCRAVREVDGRSPMKSEHGVGGAREAMACLLDSGLGLAFGA